MRMLALLAAGAVLAGCNDETGDGSKGYFSTRDQNPPQPKLGLSVDSAPPSPAALDGPLCDNPEVVEFVIDAFNAVQDFETRSGVSLTALSEIADLGAKTLAEGDWRQIRNCEARAALTSGATISSWHQIRLPSIDDATGYRVKVCFAEYDPVSGGDCTAFERIPE